MKDHLIPIPGESKQERKKRLRRIANQKHKYKTYPDRKPANPTRAGLLFTKESLLSNCLTDSDTGCWNWQRARHEFGYGIAMENKKHVRMNRRAWELWIGPIPPGMFVCHRCDNPPCCNPDHLFLGNNLDNMTDMHTKKRWTVPNRKLTYEQAESIRNDPRKLTILSEQYGVSCSVLSGIKTGKRYKTP